MENVSSDLYTYSTPRIPGQPFLELSSNAQIYLEVSQENEKISKCLAEKDVWIIPDNILMRRLNDE